MQSSKETRPSIARAPKERWATDHPRQLYAIEFTESDEDRLATFASSEEARCRAILDFMDRFESKRRWYRVTPDRLIIGLLVVECLLWLSDWLGCPAWHKGYAVLAAAAAVSAGTAAMLGWCGAAVALRWRFQFGIRTLLVMAIVVAFPCSWLMTELAAAKKQREAIAAIVTSGGNVSYDYEVDALGMKIPARNRPYRHGCESGWGTSSS